MYPSTVGRPQAPEGRSNKPTTKVHVSSLSPTKLAGLRGIEHSLEFTLEAQFQLAYRSEYRILIRRSVSSADLSLFGLSTLAPQHQPLNVERVLTTVSPDI